MPAPDHVELIKLVKHKNPILFFCFSRLTCEKHAFELSKKKFFKPDPEISKIVRERLRDAPPDTKRLKSARILQDCLPKGIGFHHAGLLPVLKDIVEEWGLGTGEDFGDFTSRLGILEREIRELSTFEKGADARLTVLEQRLAGCREARK